MPNKKLAYVYHEVLTMDLLQSLLSNNLWVQYISIIFLIAINVKKIMPISSIEWTQMWKFLHDATHCLQPFIVCVVIGNVLVEISIVIYLPNVLWYTYKQKILNTTYFLDGTDQSVTRSGGRVSVYTISLPSLGNFQSSV